MDENVEGQRRQGELAAGDSPKPVLTSSKSKRDVLDPGIFAHEIPTILGILSLLI